MRVLVTGAGGLIGSHVARLLVARGHEVVATVREGTDRLHDVLSALTVRRLDVLDETDARRLVNEGAPDACVHCAWYAEPGRYVNATVNEDHRRAGLALARALAETGCRRFVGVGTCIEYADSADPLTESSPTGPTTRYAAAKLALCEDLRAFSAETSVSVAWARVFYLYGPYEDPRRLVPSVTLSLLAGEPARTTDGTQIRDFTYVEDVASALVTLAEEGAEGVFNVATGRASAVRDLVRALGEIVGRPDLVEVGALERPRDERPVVAATGMRLVSELGWQPQHSLEDGLRRTVDWWRARL